MATDIKSLTLATQDQVLKAVSSAQSSVLDGVESWTSATQKLVPSNLPTLGSLPGVDLLPTPSEAVSLSFGFVEKLLVSQRQFAEQLFAAGMTPSAPATKAKA